MKFNKIFFLLLLIGLLTACSNLSNSEARNKYHEKYKKDTIYIGIAWPLEDYSESFLNGLNLAKEKINQKGVLDNKKIEFIFKDDKSSVTDGLKVANEFGANKDIFAVIGHRDSYISLPTSAIYNSFGILMMTPGSTNPQITNQGFDYVIRTIPSDYFIGKEAAEYFIEKKYKNVVIYYEKTDYGRALANSFEDKATLSGINIVDRRPFESGSEREFRVDLNYWSYLEFDAFFLAAVMPAGPEFIKTARQNGFIQPVIGGDGLDHIDLISLGEKDVEGTVAMSVFNPNENRKIVKNFKNEFYEKYNENPDVWAAQAYDTLNLLVYAINTTKTTQPAKLSEFIKNIDSYEGVSGFHKFDKNGDVIDKNIVKKIVVNSKFNFLEEK
ncbi:MAG: ABC transporter substrate-binding protein [Candidatus Muiribacteriota bacterium]